MSTLRGETIKAGHFAEITVTALKLMSDDRNDRYLELNNKRYIQSKMGTNEQMLSTTLQ